MKIMEEERAQGSAELILLFGGIIVIALVALISYRNYIDGVGGEISGDTLNETTSSILDLKDKFT